MQKNKYIGSFEFIDNGRGGEFKVELLGRINNCGVIRPRFYVTKDDYKNIKKGKVYRFMNLFNFKNFRIDIWSKINGKSRTTSTRIKYFINQSH